MKKQLLTSLAILSMLSVGRATLFIQGTTDQGTSGTVAHQTIYDGSPGYLTVNSMDLTSAGLGSSLSSLAVTLNISGGMNNGLYGYLVAPNGTMVILMNQPGYGVDGFGAMGGGMNITLQDGSGTHGSIQNETSGATLGGSYNVAGSLSGFDGGNPNGMWTLYFSDTITGGGNATLHGWSLDITAVPEPVTLALVVFLVMLLALAGLRWAWRT